MQAFVDSVVEQLGKGGLVQIVCTATLGYQRGLDSLDQLRDALRANDVFIPDDCFQSIEASLKSQPSSSNAKGSPATDSIPLRFVAALLAQIPPRRRHVVDLAWGRMDTEKTRAVPLRLVRAFYDVARHPELLAGRLEANVLVQEFIQNFCVFGGGDAEGKVEQNFNSRSVTFDMFLAYYVGVSRTIKSDEQFELLLIRSWQLDRAAEVVSASVAANLSSGSNNASMISAGIPKSGKKSIQMSSVVGRDSHPLYSTSSMEYGNKASTVKLEPPAHGLTQAFTKNAVINRGSSTTMNI